MITSHTILWLSALNLSYGAFIVTIDGGQMGKIENNIPLLIE